MPTLTDDTLREVRALDLTPEQVELATIDPDNVDSEVLKRALKRARERLNGEITAKHGSHSSHNSHGTHTW
jgi:hypothetical protein